MICPKCGGTAESRTFDSPPIGLSPMERETRHNAYCPICQISFRAKDCFGKFDAEYTMDSSCPWCSLFDKCKEYTEKNA